MPNKFMLRDLMFKTTTSMFCGAYDGLSSRIATAAGFDAIWASGFCICTSKGLPDRNVITPDELRARAAEITDSSNLPVLVDCDEGYGHAESTCRLAKSLRRIGVQGICIEDNANPKINSFMLNQPRRLASLDEHCEKLYRVKKAVPDLFLVGRTEALVCGEPLETAILRAAAYADAGAEAIIIHSTSKDFGTFAAIASAWTKSVPLIVIPSVADDALFSSFSNAGYRAVVYANQLMRVSVAATCRMMSILRKSGDPSRIKAEQVSVAELLLLFTESAVD